MDDLLCQKLINCQFFEDVDVTGIIDNMSDNDLTLDIDFTKGRLMDDETNFDAEDRDKCELPVSWFDKAHNFDLCTVSS